MVGGCQCLWQYRSFGVHFWVRIFVILSRSASIAFLWKNHKPATISVAFDFVLKLRSFFRTKSSQKICRGTKFGHLEAVLSGTNVFTNGKKWWTIDWKLTKQLIMKFFNGFSCDYVHVICLHCTSAGCYDALSGRYFTCQIQWTLSYLTPLQFENLSYSNILHSPLISSTFLFL